MSRLTIYPISSPEQVILNTTQADELAAELQKIGVSFERWAPKTPLPKDADDQAVLHAYSSDIERISKAEGYNSVDLIRVFPDNPKCAEIRAKFLAEHTHDDDEARFFVEGSGVFYVHADEKVFMILCEQGDFIRVPKNTPHWFDMSATPYITAIRWFTNADGWIPNFTGQDYSEVFPRYEQKPRAA